MVSDAVVWAVMGIVAVESAGCLLERGTRDVHRDGSDLALAC